jgi:hypothetical protein
MGVSFSSVAVVGLFLRGLLPLAVLRDKCKKTQPDQGCGFLFWIKGARRRFVCPGGARLAGAV